MTTFTYSQNSFCNGELSSGYISRNDLTAKANGVSTLSNAHTTFSGAIKRRRGLRYVASLKEQGKLFSFNYKTRDTYLIILSDLKMYIYKDDKLISTLAIPYLQDEISQIQTSQNLTQMIFTHQNYAPKILTFVENYGFVFNTILWENNSTNTQLCPHYNFPDTKNILLTPSAKTGDIKITSNVNFFNSTHINMNLKINDGWVKILNIISPREVFATVQTALTELTSCNNFYEPAFSATRGFPKASAFHQGRLIFASTMSQPNKIWFSKTHDYFNFDCGEGLDDEGIEFSLLSSGMEEIQTLFSSQHLQILTYSGEWVITSDHITPSTVAITKQTTIGSPADIYLPITQIESTTIFISKDKKEVREFVYGQVLGNYTSNDLSILAPHLIRSPVDITYNKTHNQLYIVLSNGNMAVLTILPQNQIVSWSSYNTSGNFLSTTSIDDKVYTIVQRSNGIFLERFDSKVNTDCTMENEMDISLYENCEVFIKQDSYVFANDIITSCPSNLPQNYTVGLPYQHTILPFPMTKVQGNGYKKHRLIQFGIKMEDSYVLELDTGFGLNKIYLTNQDFDTPLKSFCGDYFVNTLGYKDNQNSPLWKIQSQLPFDFCMQSISLKIKAI